MSLKHIKPEAWQESVWDYPSPPGIEDFSKHIKVMFKGEEGV